MKRMLRHASGWGLRTRAVCPLAAALHAFLPLSSPLPPRPLSPRTSAATSSTSSGICCTAPGKRSAQMSCVRSWRAWRRGCTYVAWRRRRRCRRLRRSLNLLHACAAAWSVRSSAGVRSLAWHHWQVPCPPPCPTTSRSDAYPRRCKPECGGTLCKSGLHTQAGLQGGAAACPEHGSAAQRSAARSDKARHSTARHGTARCGTCRQG